MTVRDEPIPTFPVRLDAPDIPRVAPEILLVTDNESNIAAEETVKDWPIPTFPVVVRIEELMSVADKAWRMEEPKTVKPPLA